MSIPSVDRRLEASESPVAGILYVRTYGFMDDRAAAFRTWKTRNPGMILIDDRCPSPPEPEDCDTQGADAVLFSTGYGKYVDLGFGGFAWLSDEIEYARSDAAFLADDAGRLETLYKHHIDTGQPLTSLPDKDGFRHWIPSAPIHMPVAGYLDRIRHDLKRAADQKARLNEIYLRGIPDRCHLGPRYNDWRFQIRVPDKPGLLSQIFGCSLFASGHYYPASRLFDHGHCKQAELLYGDVINLFNDQAMTAEQARQVVQIVAEHLEGSR